MELKKIVIVIMVASVFLAALTIYFVMPPLPWSTSNSLPVYAKEETRTFSFEEPPVLNEEMNSSESVISDLEGIGCKIIYVEDFAGKSFGAGLNYTEFRRVAYNSKVVFCHIYSIPQYHEEHLELLTIFNGLMCASYFLFKTTPTPTPSPEQLTFIGYSWASDLSHFNVTIKNTGSGKLTISDVKIGETSANWDVVAGSKTLDARDTATIQITGDFTSGTLYEFYVVTANGNTFGPFSKRAP